MPRDMTGLKYTSQNKNKETARNDKNLGTSEVLLASFLL
jgi:hypothetical protein